MKKISFILAVSFLLFFSCKDDEPDLNLNNLPASSWSGISTLVSRSTNISKTEYTIGITFYDENKGVCSRSEPGNINVIYTDYFKYSIDEKVVYITDMYDGTWNFHLGGHWFALKNDKDSLVLVKNLVAGGEFISYLYLEKKY